MGVMNLQQEVEAQYVRGGKRFQFAKIDYVTFVLCEGKAINVPALLEVAGAPGALKKLVTALDAQKPTGYGLTWDVALVLVKRKYRELRDAQRYPRRCSRDARAALDWLEDTRWWEEEGVMTHGVEGFCAKDGQSSVHYLNTGETYNTTMLALCGAENTTFRVGNWGDIVEANEGKYN
jgi:hypothetical protein